MDYAQNILRTAKTRLNTNLIITLKKNFSGAFERSKIRTAIALCANHSAYMKEDIFVAYQF